MNAYDFDPYTDAMTEARNLATWIRNGGSAGELAVGAAQWITDPTNPPTSVTPIDSLISWWTADLFTSANQDDLDWHCGMFVKALREAHSLSAPSEDWVLSID